MNLHLMAIDQRKYVIYSFSAVAFFIPLWPEILPPLIAVTILLLLVYINRSTLRISNHYILLLLPLYLLYMVGLLYSEDLYHGFKDVETKLSLIIYPLLFSVLSPIFTERNKINTVFLSGCFASMAFNLVGAGYRFYNEYSETGFFNFFNFFYFNLSPVIHPSYMALYICLSISLIFHKLINNNYNDSTNYLLILGLTGMILFVFMLSSKAGIIAMIFILLYYSVFLFKSKLDIKKILLPAIFVIILFGSFFQFVPGATTRLEINPSVLQKEVPIDRETDDTSALRVLIWLNSIELIRKNMLFGVGTGDVKNELIKIYEKNGITQAVKHQLNSHNQFLQTWIAIGVFGFICLLPWIFLSVYKGFKNNYSPQLILGGIVFLNFLFESMLETQAGVIFISFFSTLFLFTKTDNQ